MLQVTTGWLEGMVAPSRRPTMISSSGSHSLCEFTGECADSTARGHVESFLICNCISSPSESAAGSFAGVAPQMGKRLNLLSFRPRTHI